MLKTQYLEFPRTPPIISMGSFSPRDLYGGAITTNLPADFIDPSNLRQIPDHQEFYLSPKTLTNIIVEINQYVSPLTASEVNHNITTSATTHNPEAGDQKDKAAALYHLQDLVDSEDTLTSVSNPKSVQMQSPSLHGFPAFTVQGKVTARERQPGVPSVLPEEYQSTQAYEVETTTTVRLLLVRIESKSTDLCVIVNVPWKEMEAQSQVEEEEGFADAVLENVIASLDVRDFGLFCE